MHRLIKLVKIKKKKAWTGELHSAKLIHSLSWQLELCWSNPDSDIVKSSVITVQRISIDLTYEYQLGTQVSYKRDYNLHSIIFGYRPSLRLVLHVHDAPELCLVPCNFFWGGFKKDKHGQKIVYALTKGDRVFHKKRTLPWESWDLGNPKICSILLHIKLCRCLRAEIEKKKLSIDLSPLLQFPTSFVMIVRVSDCARPDSTCSSTCARSRLVHWRERSFRLLARDGLFVPFPQKCRWCTLDGHTMHVRSLSEMSIYFPRECPLFVGRSEQEHFSPGHRVTQDYHDLFELSLPESLGMNKQRSDFSWIQGQIASKLWLNSMQVHTNSKPTFSFLQQDVVDAVQ